LAGRACDVLSARFREHFRQWSWIEFWTMKHNKSVQRTAGSRFS
jgi:hypothetical protein